MITELCPAQNVVGVTLIRIMCCMNNTATSSHHKLPRCLASTVPGSIHVSLNTLGAKILVDNLKCKLNIHIKQMEEIHQYVP